MIIVKGVEGDYVIDTFGCTCMAGIFGKKCKHIKEAERLGVIKMPVSVSESKPQKSFPSFLRGLNEMVGEDFYNSDIIVAIHGKPSVGKTLYALHECIHLLSIGGNFLYIDTEGGFKSMVAKWWPVLEKRFLGSGRKGDGYVEVRKTLTSLHEFLGFKTSVLWVKEKMEFRILEKMKEAPIDEFIEKKKIDFVVLDSVSMPVATAINEEQQNRPARFTATALIMGKLAEIQEKYNCCVLTINHTSWNPSNPYESFGQMRGGKIVHHYAKRIVYIDSRQKSELANFRRFWLVRAENIDKFGDVAFAFIDDSGMHDIDIKTGWKAGILTDNEVEYVKDTGRWSKVLEGEKK